MAVVDTVLYTEIGGIVILVSLVSVKIIFLKKEDLLCVLKMGLL